MPDGSHPRGQEEQDGQRQQRQVHVLRELLTVCPAMPIADAQRRDIHLGGGESLQCPERPQVFQAGDPLPAEQSAAVAGNVAAVKNIIEVYATNARKHERVGEWIERVGWERFFNLTGIPFTDKHIDDFDMATETFSSSTLFKWR